VDAIGKILLGLGLAGGFFRIYLVGGQTCTVRSVIKMLTMLHMLVDDFRM